jgi:hypothetical protein
MATIFDYAADPQRALVDAATDPVFKQFIDSSDVEVVTVTQGGVQSQAQALKKSSVSKVIRRILAASKAAGENLLDLICSPNEFNLCYQLKNSLPGVAMTMLNDFLISKIGRWVSAGVGIFAAFAVGSVAVVAGKFVAIFVAIGIAYEDLHKLCNCPDA